MLLADIFNVSTVESRDPDLWDTDIFLRDSIRLYILFESVLLNLSSFQVQIIHKMHY